MRDTSFEFQKEGLTPFLKLVNTPLHLRFNQARSQLWGRWAPTVSRAPFPTNCLHFVHSQSAPPHTAWASHARQPGYGPGFNGRFQVKLGPPPSSVQASPTFHPQPSDTSFFTGRMHFLSPNQQCEATNAHCTAVVGRTARPTVDRRALVGVHWFAEDVRPCSTAGS